MIARLFKTIITALQTKTKHKTPTKFGSNNKQYFDNNRTIALELLMPNSVTTIFGFSPTGRHETIRITEGDSKLIYNLSSYKCQIYVLVV